MKWRLLIIILLAWLGSYAQPTSGTYTPISQRYNWLAGYFRALHLPAGCGFPSFQPGQWHGAGAIYLDSCALRLYYYSGVSWTAIADSSEAGGGGGGTTNHTLLSNLAWASSGHTGNSNSIAAFDGAGAATYKQIGVDIQAYNAALAQIVGLSPTNDDILQRKGGVWTNRTIAQLKTDLNYTIPAQFNPIAGTGISLTGVYPNITFNAFEDTNWVHLIAYATPNDGLQDTTGLQAAIATGKNVLIDPGIWEYPGKGNGIVLSKGQVIRGYGLVSLIHFTADTINVFNMSNDSCFIDQIAFVGKGRGSTPGAEVFTFSNAIKIGGSYNKVRNCYFSKVKGAGVTLWAGATIYGNDVSFNSFDSCGVGIYALTNAEYGQFLGNKMQYCRIGMSEHCAGNNNWVNITALYCDYGVRIFGSSGCNGDHGQITASIFNHCTTALDLRQVQNEYSLVNCKFYFGSVEFGSTDTVRRVIMDNCVFSGNTINVTKASQCQVTGGTFGTSAVTVNAGSGVTFCNIQNSPYSGIICGGSPLSNPMTTAEDIIKGGSSGTPTRLAVGADGTYLGVSGGVLQYLSLPGGGDVTKVGTPVNSQIGVWTGNGTIEGDGNFTWDASNFGVTGTASVSTSVTSPLLIGTSSTTAGIILKASTGNASGANPALTVNGGNNGASQLFRVDHNGMMGLGTNPSSTVRLFIVGSGTSTSTLPILVRNSSAVNLFQVDDGGNWRLGNQSTASVGMMYYRNAVGTTTVFTPTAWLHLGAGTSSASSAPLKFTSGTNLTTAEAGAMEFDGTNFYMSPSTTRKRIPLTNNATPSNGQIPIGNGTDYTVANITGSNGISITNGSGTIDVNLPTTTLNASGGLGMASITSGTNLDDVSVVSGSYSFTRSFNIINFSVQFNVDPTASGTTTVFHFMPAIASNFSAATNAKGTITASAVTMSGEVTADPTNDDMIATFISAGTGSVTITITGQYIVQ